jgi:hypothetical protein
MWFKYNGIEDLVFNSSFRNWVLAGQSSQTTMWTEWEKQNPDKAELIKCAKAIVCALQIDFDTLSNDQVNEEIAKAIEKFRHSYESLN